MDRKLGVAFNEKFGYFIDMRSTYEWHELPYTSSYGFMDDKKWINFFGYDKNYYIDTLIKEFNAYQNATREYPKLFFRKKEDAVLALHDFYEPAALLIFMSEGY